MKKSIIITLLLAICTVGAAQTDSTTTIITDRPTQSASAYLIPKGAWQIETGYGFSEFRDELGVGVGVVSTFKAQSLVMNTTLIRYGLGNGIEINLGQSLIRNRFKVDGEVLNANTEVLPTSLGLRMHLAKENGIIPQTAFLVNVSGAPFSKLRPGTSLDVRLNMQHSLGGGFSLGYNLGAILSDEFMDIAGLYTLVLGYSLTDKLSAFAEYYGSTQDGISVWAIDYGFTYLINRKFQLDIFSGNGLSDEAADTIFGLGFSVLLPKK